VLASRVGEKAADDCPTLDLQWTSSCACRQPRTRELAAAIIAFGVDLTHISLKRFGIGEPIDFDGCRDYALILGRPNRRVS